jgi:DNA-binding HxlR family transcriptional regulator
MTRDESILRALTQGDASTVELEEATGIPERTCRKGVRRLVLENYVWSPVRGTWRLTRRGRELAEELAAAAVQRKSQWAPRSPGPRRPSRRMRRRHNRNIAGWPSRRQRGRCRRAGRAHSASCGMRASVG